MERERDVRNQENNSRFVLVLAALFIMLGTFFTSPGDQGDLITGKPVSAGAMESSSTLSGEVSCNCPLIGTLTRDGCSNKGVCAEETCSKEVRRINLDGQITTHTITESCKNNYKCDNPGADCSRQGYWAFNYADNDQVFCTRTKACPTSSDTPCETNECTYACAGPYWGSPNGYPVQLYARYDVSFSCGE